MSADPRPDPPKLRLTRGARAHLFAGRAPRITGEGKCPISKGYVYTLSPGFWLEVTSIRRTKTGGWTLAYTVYDTRHRGALLRRVPPVHVDEAETLAPTADAIERARLEGSYTSNVRAAVSDAGDGVGDRWLQSFARDSDQEKLLRLVKAEERIKKRALEDRLAEVLELARREGIDISSPLRVIERQVARAEGRVRGKAA